MTNLRQIPQFLFHSQPTAIKPQEYASELLKCRKLSIVDVCSLVLLESINKEPAIAKIGCDDDSRASALTTTGAATRFLNTCPPKSASIRPADISRDRGTQMPVGKRRFAKPAAERLCLEDSTPRTYCITWCYSRQLTLPLAALAVGLLRNKDFSIGSHAQNDRHDCIQCDRFDITCFALAQRAECKRDVTRVAISRCISETG